jgi:hypothetical protein
LATGTPKVIPGLVLDPPKATPAEKWKRIAAKAAKAAKANLAVQAPNTTEGAKIVVTIKGPPQNTGRSLKSPPQLGGRNRQRLGKGPVMKGRHLRDINPQGKDVEDAFFILYILAHRLVVSRGNVSNAKLFSLKLLIYAPIIFALARLGVP